MSTSRALGLGRRKHNTILHFIIKSRPLRVREHDSHLREQGFEVQCYAAYGSPGACAGYEGVETAVGLAVDLRARGVLVCEIVGGVFELVCEEAAGVGVGGGGFGCVGCGAAPGEVDELILVDWKRRQGLVLLCTLVRWGRLQLRTYTCWPYALDGCA